MEKSRGGALTTLMTPDAKERARERRNLNALETIYKLFEGTDGKISEEDLLEARTTCLFPHSFLPSPFSLSLWVRTAWGLEVVRAGCCRLLDREVTEFCKSVHGEDRDTATVCPS